MATNSFLLFQNMGGTELILILVVVLLLFGAKKIPELARGMGQGIREFREASRDVKREIEKAPEAREEGSGKA